MQSQTVHMEAPSPKRPRRNAAIGDEAAESECVAAYNGTSERAIQVRGRRELTHPVSEPGRRASPVRFQVAGRPPRQRKSGGAFEMGAHARRRGFRVAIENCLRDGAVLLNRGLEHGWRQHIADLGHDERQLQPRRELAQLKIVGERHHRVMEGGVLLEILAWVPGRVGVDRLGRGDEARAPLGSVRPGGEPGGKRLHFDPNQEQFADLALGQAPHDRSAVRPMLDQPVGGEAPQRLPHWSAADRKRAVRSHSTSRDPGWSRPARMASRRRSTMKATVAP